ncbi:MAG: hypothetical protein WCJ42_00150 [Actinomycetes bacterium]
MFRTAVLVAWGNSWLAGQAAADDLLDAVAPPRVIRDSDGEDRELLQGLRELQRKGVRGFQLALPVPGDPSGIAAEPQIIAAAVAVQAAAVAIGCDLLLLPNDAGWSVLPYAAPMLAAGVRPPAGGQSSREAEADLTDALASTTAQLHTLDLARMRPDFERILESGWLGSQSFPTDLGERNLKLIHTAARVLQIVDMAQLDDGAALTASEARYRTGALRALALSARNALCSSVSAARLVEPK